MKFFTKIVILFIFLFIGQSVFSQTKKIVQIKINQADSLVGQIKDGERFSKLIGKVQLEHDNMLIFCDSAYHYDKQNKMEALGRVRIKQGDSITITGKKLFYDGNTKLAEMREDVIYKDDSITIYTDNLDYDMPERLAYYFDGGKVVDKENVLNSKKGYYDLNKRFVSFKDSAVLVTPESVIKSDTLQYDVNTDIAFFRGPTEILKKDGTKLLATKGKYFTRIEKSEIEEGVIEFNDQILEGDKLDFDEVEKFYSSTGHAKLINVKDEVVITGDYGKYWATDSITKVYGHALLKKAFNNDTLYLSADTLISITSPNPAKKLLLAYNNVKVYNTSLQGKADSLAYHVADSMLFFFNDPIIWNEDSQITADSINLTLSNGDVEQMDLNQNAFIVSKDSVVEKFNQIKGREMITYFKDNSIKQVDVFGNAESVFFVIENDSVFFGMNKIICSDMRILFKEGEMDRIKTYVKPDATLTPPHELDDADTQLEKFAWRDDERPTKEEVIKGIIKKPKAKEEKKDSEIPRKKSTAIVKKQTMKRGASRKGK